VTAGDPAGIGPEIVARSLADGRLSAAGRVAVVAEPALFDAACRDAALDPLPRWDPHEDAPADFPCLLPVDAAPVPADFALGQPSAYTGRIAALCVEVAAKRALAGQLDAIVTAPLAKAALRAAGNPYPGHTEFLAALCGGPPVAMMFVAGELRLTLVTIHVPLAEVPRLVTPERVLTSIRLTRECLRNRLGIAEPRIAVLGLNPHAGEGGLFGPQEETQVEPALAAAREKGWRVEGPFPADSFFHRRRREYDAVVALYHDQGLIPVKLLSHGVAVNVTLGLPFLRTSVDHGTAFDIAGRGLASAASLVAAARLAAEWTRTRSAPA
jgi:4-hydroxythreonine-4-phosphate dehydrogenase